MTSDTPRVDAIPNWSARCGAQDDEKIITHGDLLALAHDEADELRELASTLERKLNGAQANILVKDTAWMQRAIDAEAKLAAKTKELAECKAHADGFAYDGCMFFPYL